MHEVAAKFTKFAGLTVMSTMWQIKIINKDQCGRSKAGMTNALLFCYIVQIKFIKIYTKYCRNAMQNDQT